MSYDRKTPHRPAAKPGRHDSATRRAHNLAALVARFNARAGLVTAAAYLAERLHAPAEFVKSYSSPFGKAAAKAYREQYATEPAKSGLDVRGKHLVRVFTYTVEILQKAAASYTRTAALLEVA